MLGKLWSVETRLFLIFWLGLLWFGQSQFLFDPGVFWNTVVGQRIVASGDVPRQEEFSCTIAGRPWQSHQWLAQVAMAGLHAIGGLDALALGAATLLAATYAWAIGRLVRAGCHWIVVVLFAVLLFLGSRYHWLARPQLATIALLGWTYAQLVDFEAGLVSWRRLYWLPAAFVLWTNLHGGALGGLCTVAFVLGGWCVAWLIGWPSPLRDRADVSRAILVGVGCVLATLVNPYGWELPLGWIRLMTQNLSAYIVEHAPLNWNSPIERGIVVFGFVYVVVLATVPWRQWRVSWLVPVVWFVLTLQRVRHCTLFSITAIVALAEALPHTRLTGWVRPPKERSVCPLLAWVVPALAVSIALTLEVCAIRVPLVGAGHATIDRALAPTKLLDAIRQRSKPGDAIFNDIAFGGFLVYYAPELRIYSDDRCELYGDEFMAKLNGLSAKYDRLRHEKADPAPHDELDRWTDEKKIRLALVVKGQGFDYYLRHSPRWTRIDETEGHVSPASVPGAVLYERK